MIPVSVIGPVPISLGRYELRELDGAVVENGREAEDVYAPLAHTEGGLSASLYRGARGGRGVGRLPDVRAASDRITRASCFVCKSAGDALALARWLETELPALRLVMEQEPSRRRSARACAR